MAKSETQTINSAETGKVDDVLNSGAGTDVALGNGVHGKTLILGGVKFKATQVTRNLIKQVENHAVHVQLTAAIYQGKTLKGAKLKADGTPEMEPARLVECVDLTSGSLSLLIVNAVLEGALNEQYPDQSYIGKYFTIIMRPGPEGKRYKTFELFELETDGETA